jgi:16S rRNA (guanine527-N7)-methyltransferase
LLEWNTKINLTAITEPTQMAVRHFCDSLTLLAAFNPPQGATAADVGTGAGFPGLVLLIARPDLKITLIDSLKKRLAALADILEKLGLDAALIHARAEDAGRPNCQLSTVNRQFPQPPLRETFDLVTARAVADLTVLSELCLPFCRVGGVFAAMKGRENQGEISSALPRIRALGGEIGQIHTFTLPDSSERQIPLIKKISQTPTDFPRSFSKINKKK